MYLIIINWVVLVYNRDKITVVLAVGGYVNLVY